MSDYDCIHGYDISQYKCPKCEAGIFLADEEIQQAIDGIDWNQSNVLIRFARAILRKAQEK